jgi:hypothetical protein
MKPRSYFVAALAVVSSIVTLAACSDDSNSPALTADFRLLHADAAAGAIDVTVGGMMVLQGITYGHASAVTRVPGGVQHIVLTSGGSTVAELDADMSETTINSVTLAATGAQVATVVVPDTGAVAGDRANIRMVNVVGANSEPPTLLDIKVTAPAPDTVMTFGIDTQIARYGTLMYFDPGTFTFKFRPAGESTVLAEVTFDVAAGQTKDVVLERASDGTYSATVVIEE